MNKIILITTTTAIALFTGCTGGGPDMSKSSVRQAISSVTVYNNLEGRQFTKKGTVESRYCQNDGVQSSMSMMGNITKEIDALKTFGFTNVQIVEAVAITGYFNYINTLSNVFDLG